MGQAHKAGLTVLSRDLVMGQAHKAGLTVLSNAALEC